MRFGGSWSKAKIEILVKYARAYLEIMKSHPYFHLLYFDGFAGSGIITHEGSTAIEETIGAARRIVEIEEPISFNEYYFVEKNPENAKRLKQSTKDLYPQKTIHVVNDDCNTRLQSMANFLRKPENKQYRILAYIDPCGMQLEWSALSSLAYQNVDAWILVPTGLGVNRLLKRNGQISDEWLNRLSRFLGMESHEILEYFYVSEKTLFDEVSKKKLDAVNKSAELYKQRLNDIFKEVSEPFVLKNTTNSIMYHLFCASQNSTAIKIANEIVSKEIKTR